MKFGPVPVAEAGHMARIEDRALLDDPGWLPHRMGEDRSSRLADRNRPELHAAASFAMRPRLLSAPITCARIATAI
ncbi:MAG: hypothetical protein K8F58_10725, partial [Bauldia sp.]|nr:hypothetical protein [Bauldia sp.]